MDFQFKKNVRVVVDLEIGDKVVTVDGFLMRGFNERQPNKALKPNREKILRIYSSAP